MQAAINAVYTDGPATGWTQVLALYDQLPQHTPTPIVALNRAAAVAEVHGPAQALAAIGELDPPGYHLLPAGLVDHVQVTIFPVISGQTGVDPIFQRAADFDLELIESRTLDGHTQELI